MKQFTRKSISVLLSLLMVLSVFAGLAFTVSAADVVESGSCGSGTSYTIDSDGLLTITGSGFITNQVFRDKGTFRRERRRQMRRLRPEHESGCLSSLRQGPHRLLRQDRPVLPPHFLGDSALVRLKFLNQKAAFGRLFEWLVVAASGQ